MDNAERKAVARSLLDIYGLINWRAVEDTAMLERRSSETGGRRKHRRARLIAGCATTVCILSGYGKGLQKASG